MVGRIALTGGLALFLEPVTRAVGRHPGVVLFKADFARPGRRATDRGGIVRPMPLLPRSSLSKVTEDGSRPDHLRPPSQNVTCDPVAIRLLTACKWSAPRRVG